jgi:hypothetical protein
MALIDPKDFQDMPVEDTWARGWYLFKITGAKEYSREGGDRVSLGLELTCEEDIGKKNAYDVTNQRVNEFVQTKGYESHKDGGDFARRRIAGLLKAADLLDASDEVGPEDFIGKYILGLVTPGKDRDGMPVNQVNRFAHPDVMETTGSNGASASEYA